MESSMEAQGIPFNLELARSGWPVLFYGDEAQFIGMDSAGQAVIETLGKIIMRVDAQHLNMARRCASHDLEQSLQHWFGLSYAQFLTLPRVIMEAMPDEWQRAMAALLRQMDEQWDWLPANGQTYFVRMGRPAQWPYDKKPVLVEPDADLCNYRHPKIEHRRKRAVAE